MTSGADAHREDRAVEATESAAIHPPVVLVYIPGLGEPANAADAFANRFAIALDEESPVAPATYHVRPPASGEAISAPDAVPRRVIEVLDGNSRPVVDIYRLEYGTDLRRGFAGASRVIQAVKLGLLVLYTAIFAVVPMLLTRRLGKGGKAKAQWVFAMAVFAGLALYAIVLVVATLHASVQITHKHPQLGVLEYVSLAGAALATIVPSRVQTELTAAAVDFYAAASYLALGTRRSNLSSDLSRLLETVVEGADPTTRIYLVAYSFGSVVALDSLFPPGQPPPARMARVSGLVTVGCPFDLIRTVWPRYFQGRVAGPAPATWLNVFAPLDVLGSNFMDGGDNAVAPEAVTVRRRQKRPQWVGVAESGGPRKSGDSGDDCRHPVNQVCQSGPLGQRASALQVLMLSGFKVHSMYWDDEDSTDVGAVRGIVTHLLSDAPGLAPVIELPGTRTGTARRRRTSREPSPATTDQ